MLPKTSSEKTGEPSWRYRRMVVFVVVLFCMITVWRMVDRIDNGLNGTIVSGVLWLLGIVTLLYTGLATLQDIIAIWRTRSALPYAQDRPPGYPADIAAPERENGQ